MVKLRPVPFKMERYVRQRGKEGGAVANFGDLLVSVSIAVVAMMANLSRCM